MTSYGPDVTAVPTTPGIADTAAATASAAPTSACSKRITPISVVVLRVSHRSGMQHLCCAGRIPRARSAGADPARVARRVGVVDRGPLDLGRGAEPLELRDQLGAGLLPQRHLPDEADRH